MGIAQTRESIEEAIENLIIKINNPKIQLNYDEQISRGIVCFKIEAKYRCDNFECSLKYNNGPLKTLYDNIIKFINCMECFEYIQSRLTIQFNEHVYNSGFCLPNRIKIYMNKDYQLQVNTEIFEPNDTQKIDEYLSLYCAKWYKPVGYNTKCATH